MSSKVCNCTFKSEYNGTTVNVSMVSENVVITFGNVYMKSKCNRLSWCNTCGCKSNEKGFRREFIPLENFTKTPDDKYSYTDKLYRLKSFNKSYLRITACKPNQNEYDHYLNLSCFSINDAAVSLPIIVCPIVALLLVVIIFFVLFKLNQYRRWPFLSTKAWSYNEEFAKKVFAQKRIFIVFSNDHPYYKDVILKFASCLAQCGFEISLDLYSKENIYVDPATWLDQSLASDFVLVIWSPGVCARWKNLKADYDRNDMCAPALKHIYHNVKLCKDVSHYMFAYFDFCDSQSLPQDADFKKIPKFQLIKDFDRLLINVTKKIMKSSYISSKHRLGKAVCSDPDLTSALYCMAEMVKENHNWHNSASFI